MGLVIVGCCVTICFDALFVAALVAALAIVGGCVTILLVVFVGVNNPDIEFEIELNKGVGIFVAAGAVFVAVFVEARTTG